MKSFFFAFPLNRLRVLEYRIEVPNYCIEVPNYRVGVLNYRVEVPSYRVEVPNYRVEVPKYTNHRCRNTIAPQLQHFVGWALAIIRV